MYTLTFQVSDHARKEIIEKKLSELEHKDAHKLFDGLWILSNEGFQKFQEVIPLFLNDDQFIFGMPSYGIPNKLNHTTTEWIQHALGKEMFPSAK